MLILYHIICDAGSRFLSAASKYTMLRIALLYFLIPLPSIRSFYHSIFHNVFGWEPYLDADIPIEGTKRIFIGDNSLILTDTCAHMFMFILVWLFGALFILTRRIIKQRREIRLIHKNARCLEEPGELSRLESLRQEYGIRRKVTVYICRLDQITSMTHGVWKPEIIIPEKVSGDAMELVIRHELVHIKRFDSFIRILSTFVVSFHWFNPFIYYFRNHLDMQCEFSCDENAIRNMDDDQRLLYAKTVLSQSRVSSGDEGSSKNKLVLELTSGGKLIKERIVYIMEKKGKRSRAHAVRSAVVIAAAVLLNSLTVFAYDDVNQVGVEPESQVVQSELVNISTSALGFYHESDYAFAEMIYEELFADENGNIYPAEGVEQRSFCNHTFQSGTVHTHAKDSDGGCTYKVYSANRCTGCAYIVIGDCLYTILFPNCPH